jgi:hypothetical protein
MQSAFGAASINAVLDNGVYPAGTVLYPARPYA